MVNFQCCLYKFCDYHDNSDSTSKYKKKQLEREIVETELKISEENNRKEQMKNDMKKSSETEKLERIARDKLNMKKEGETTYKVIEK